MENKNYVEIDKKTKYRYKEDRIKAAEEAGYDTIAEHIVQSYRKTSSLRHTAKLCDISVGGVRNILQKCNEEIRGPGGRVWSKLSKEDIEYIRSKKYMTERAFVRLAKEIEEKNSKIAGTCISISPQTIKNVYKNKTHNKLDKRMRKI